MPNHTSDQHPWFRAALRDGPGSPARARYHFADEPTDWQSVFGGPAWTRVPDGQSYLHLYDPAQPDLNWANPEVRAEFERILRFWLDRGVDGFRVDVAHGLVKDPTYPSYGGSPLGLLAKRGAPYWDQDEVHDIYRSWRAILDGYTAADPSQPRILCGEANVAIERAIRYVRPDELHQTFNFPYLQTPLEPVALRQVIDESLTAYGSVGAPATWVLSNHDVVRHASRYGYPADAQPRMGVGADDPQPDAALGLRRARAAILLMLALPGSAYLYQGEELGLPEHTTMPDDARQDPNWERSGHTERGRDGCRVPLPWVAGIDGLGFTDGVPWLPQPDSFDAYARNRQEERARLDPAPVRGGARVPTVTVPGHRRAPLAQRSGQRGAGLRHGRHPGDGQSRPDGGAAAGRRRRAAGQRTAGDVDRGAGHRRLVPAGRRRSGVAGRDRLGFGAVAGAVRHRVHQQRMELVQPDQLAPARGQGGGVGVRGGDRRAARGRRTGAAWPGRSDRDRRGPPGR